MELGGLLKLEGACLILNGRVCETAARTFSHNPLRNSYIHVQSIFSYTLFD